MATPQRNWSDAENEATVASYLAMLKLELTGVEYKKTEENARLRALLDDRSKGAVELKHQNISAVLAENDWIYIEGYKPRRNFQAGLRLEVERQLAADPELQRLENQRSNELISRATHPMGELALVDPPNLALPEQAEWRRREVGVKRDYATRDANNRRMGLDGEKAVLAYEKRRLAALGCQQLADAVEHVSVTLGDGLGYDIRSFDEDGTERFIEVKTTVHARETPFLISYNEVAASEYYNHQYVLYRLFRFGSESNGFYQLRGRLSAVCHLRPTTFEGFPHLDEPG